MFTMIEYLKNIFTASTNLVAIIPIKQSYKSNDFITCSFIMNAMTASLISHLFESHKHGLYGFGMPHIYSYYLNRWDVISAILLFLRIVYLIFENKERIFNLKFGIILDILVKASLYMICNKISEQNKTLAYQHIFLLYHNIWHTGIFLTLRDVLVLIYKK